jgi:rhodanese-related sulfurtransferase
MSIEDKNDKNDGANKTQEKFFILLDVRLKEDFDQCRIEGGISNSILFAHI